MRWCRYNRQCGSWYIVERSPSFSLVSVLSEPGQVSVPFRDHSERVWHICCVPGAALGTLRKRFLILTTAQSNRDFDPDFLEEETEAQRGLVTLLQLSSEEVAGENSDSHRSAVTHRLLCSHPHTHCLSGFTCKQTGTGSQVVMGSSHSLLILAVSPLCSVASGKSLTLCES